MFLLVPAHPGCPGQIPQSRKTLCVLCVCVWVFVLHVVSEYIILHVNNTNYTSTFYSISCKGFVSLS